MSTRTPTTNAHARRAACIAAMAILLTAGATAADPKLARYEADERIVAAHIATFDTLDFDVFTHQKWDRLHESHSKDIIVHWPDGHQTRGIDKHIEDLKAMFVYAPDTRIEVRPIKFGSGDWTGVVGVMEGTFTKPMPIGDGKTLAPTVKPFKFWMATVGNDGVMDE